MNTNDALLVKMMEKDMFAKGILESGYSIVEDTILLNPTQINVQSNEVAYICYFSTNTPNGFNIRLQSSTGIAQYHTRNTSATPVGSFESSIITSHWSTVNIQNPSNAPFFIRYIKIVYTKP